ncbi:MAG TPA: glutathione S-transferase family protein [Gammaproteobacteria bacterium]|nr:glutathione S-transferase family protein [Gammaproteobacteria bacterium]
MQELQLVIGNKSYSSWSMRAWLALKHTHAVFQEIVVPLDVPGYKQKLLAYAPTGKVPVLKAGASAIWDSLAICEYLAERFPEARLWPQDTAARAHARSVSAEMHSGFPVIRREYPFNCRATDRHVARTPELEYEIGRVQALWSQCRERFGTGGPWLFGNFTIADCMYIPVALRFVTYGTGLKGAAADYVKDVQQHPAVREWIAAAKLEKEVIEADEVGRGR